MRSLNIKVGNRCLTSSLKQLIASKVRISSIINELVDKIIKISTLTHLSPFSVSK